MALQGYVLACALIVVAQGSELAVIEQLEVSGVGGSFEGILHQQTGRSAVEAPKMALRFGEAQDGDQSSVRGKLQAATEEVQGRPDIHPLLPHLLG